MPGGYDILHVGCNVSTGPLNSILTLAAQQAKEVPGRVYVGLMGDKTWVAKNWGLVQMRPGQTFLAEAPDLWEPLRFVVMGLRRPVPRWLAAIRREDPLSPIVVHFHNAWLSSAFLPLPGRYLCGAVVTFRGMPLPEVICRGAFRTFVHRRFGKRLLAADPELVTVEKQNLGRAKAIWNIPEDRFTVVANGVEIPPASVVHRLRSPGVLHLGFVGRLTHAKGYDVAMDAVRICRRNGVEVKLHIAGDGPGEPIVRRAEREEADAFEYAGYVHNARFHFIPRLDALVLPSASEGMPVCVLEAMAAGVPCLVTPVGAIPEMITEGYNGFITSRDPWNIAERIVWLANDPTLRATMGKNARVRVEEAYSIECCSAAYRCVYERALSRRSGCHGCCRGHAGCYA